MGAKAGGAAKLKKANEDRKKAIAWAEADKRKRAPKIALKSRAEEVKKERMKASKAAYNAKMKIKQDQFKLNSKIKKNFDSGKTTRVWVLHAPVTREVWR